MLYTLYTLYTLYKNRADAHRLAMQLLNPRPQQKLHNLMQNSH